MFSDKTAARIFAGFAVFIFIVVVARLFYLQVIEGDKYSAFVASQINAGTSVSKNRGYIFDREGNILARNKTSASLYAFRRNIPNENAFFRALAKNGVSVNRKSREALSKTESFTWIDRRIDMEKAQKLVKTIPGLEYFKEETRFYPQGNLMAGIIGFTGTDNEGRSGAEYFLDSELAGKRVMVASLKDSRGRLILFEDKSDILRPDTEVYLTISSRIQAAAEYLLRQGAQKFGARDGSAVAMDIKTGEIILAASVRFFDPHNYGDYPANSWKNHGFTYVYEPGSIFKAAAFAYLYENGKLNRTKLVDTGKKFTVAGYTYSDTKDYGTLTPDEVFTHSSNIGTAMLMMGEKNSDFHAFLKKAGFGEKTGLYGAGEESGRLKNPSSWSKTSKTSIAIGYEVMVTPLQMVRFYAAIANGGVMVNPILIKKIVKDGVVKKPEHREERITSPNTAEYILDLMRKTVEDGTGINAKTMLMKVAGKTGTASIYDVKTAQYSKRNYSASFAGVFPAEDPKIAMIVVYESPTSSIYGGSTAANVFRRIAEFVSTELRYLQPELKVAAYDRE